jgi:hypothetical protein
MMLVKQLSWGLAAGAIAVLVIVATRPTQLIGTKGGSTLELFDLERYALHPLQEKATTKPALAERCLKQIIPVFAVHNARPIEAIAALRGVSGCQIIIHWTDLGVDPAVGEYKFDLALHDVPLADVLDAIIQPLTREDSLFGNKSKYRCWADGETIEVGAVGRAPSVLSTRVYDIRDLIVEGVRFSKGVAASTEPYIGEPWHEDRNEGNDLVTAEKHTVERLATVIESEVERRDQSEQLQYIHYWAGRLIVCAEAEEHRRIEQVFNDLRKTGK